MNDLVAPLCLVLSVLLFVAAIAVLANEQPQPSIELHQARVENNERFRDALEGQLEKRRRQRTTLLVCLFGMAVVLGLAGFLAMRPAGAKS